MLEIFSKNGHSNESQILLNGEPVDQCTKIQITLEVNEPVRVECETIAQPVNLKINTPHGFSELMPSAEQAAKNLREFGKSFSKINRKEKTTEELLASIARNKEILLETQLHLKNRPWLSL